MKSFALRVLLFWFCVSPWAAEFDNPDITISLSEKIRQRIQSHDSLLPDFNPQIQLKTLFRARPEIWTFGDLDTNTKIGTKLKIEFEFVDGTKDEEQYCRLMAVKKDSNEIPLEWSLKLGVDFVSGGSNIVGDHIRLCLDQTRQEMGIAIKKGDSLIYVPPKKLQDDLDHYRVNAKMNSQTRVKVLHISQEVLRTGKCPKDVRSYAILLNVWRQIKDSTRVDLIQLNQDLNSTLNGYRPITSCSFNRDWNQHYSHDLDVSCDVNAETCHLFKKPGGEQTWTMGNNSDIFQYKRFNFLGIPLEGQKSIHDGGQILDMRLIPLSENLYLESYLDLQGLPVALGLMTIGKKTDQ